MNVFFCTYGREERRGFKWQRKKKCLSCIACLARRRPYRKLPQTCGSKAPHVSVVAKPTCWMFRRSAERSLVVWSIHSFHCRALTNHRIGVVGVQVRPCIACSGRRRWRRPDWPRRRASIYRITSCFGLVVTWFGRQSMLLYINDDGLLSSWQHSQWRMVGSLALARGPLRVIFG